ncbi:MAG: iron-containing alcohol dehydrogenase [Desulfobacterales bacterium]|nr:MAG: iron-containing alcohol dehydrogenase [Desulfobacterales bacterium]
MKSQDFRFYNPVKLISGNQALDSLTYELSQMQCLRPLMVTDQGLLKAGLIDRVNESLEKSDNLTTFLYDRVPPDSSPAIVSEAAGVFREHECDSIIAVGGGSVIDTAKAVNIVVSEGAVDILALKGSRLRKPMKPFIAIPTTAGTGSEVTYAAMIRDPGLNEKVIFASYQLIPDVAILDPRMTVTLPPLVTAATAMDAMSHAMEACISNHRNPFSDAHGFFAIQLIRENLLQVIDDGEDIQGRFYLANAACMAGAAFSNSGVGIIHALGHALGGECGVAHGVAMNIFLPHGLEYNMSEVKDIIGELLLPLAGPDVYVQTPKETRAEKTVECIRGFQDQLYKHTKLSRTLSQADVKKNALEAVAQKAIKDAAVHFNPKKITYEDALALLEKAF